MKRELKCTHNGWQCLKYWKTVIILLWAFSGLNSSSVTEKWTAPESQQTLQPQIAPQFLDMTYFQHLLHSSRSWKLRLSAVGKSWWDGECRDLHGGMAYSECSVRPGCYCSCGATFSTSHLAWLSDCPWPPGLLLSSERAVFAELGASSDTSLPLRLTSDSSNGYHTQFCPDFDSLPADHVSPQGCTVSLAFCSGDSLTLSIPQEPAWHSHMGHP